MEFHVHEIVVIDIATISRYLDTMFGINNVSDEPRVSFIPRVMCKTVEQTESVSIRTIEMIADMVLKYASDSNPYRRLLYVDELGVSSDISLVSTHIDCYENITDIVIRYYGEHIDQVLVNHVISVVTREFLGQVYDLIDRHVTSLFTIYLQGSSMAIYRHDDVRAIRYTLAIERQSVVNCDKDTCGFGDPTLDEINSMYKDSGVKHAG